MKVLFQSFYFTLISLMAVTVSYADSYKAQGQFHFDNGQGAGKGIRAFKSSVVSGVPIELKLGDKTITMVFIIEPSPSVNYSLTVSLSTKPKVTAEFSDPFFTKTYQSSLVGGSNGPFEFEEQQKGVNFGGVIGLNLRH